MQEQRRVGPKGTVSAIPLAAPAVQSLPLYKGNCAGQSLLASAVLETCCCCCCCCCFCCLVQPAGPFTRQTTLPALCSKLPYTNLWTSRRFCAGCSCSLRRCSCSLRRLRDGRCVVMTYTGTIDTNRRERVAWWRNCGAPPVRSLGWVTGVEEDRLEGIASQRNVLDNCSVLRSYLHRRTVTVLESPDSPIRIPCISMQKRKNAEDFRVHSCMRGRRHSFSLLAHLLLRVPSAPLATSHSLTLVKRLQ